MLYRSPIYLAALAAASRILALRYRDHHRTGPIDNGDLAAEIGEQHRRIRARDKGSEIKHPDAVEHLHFRLSPDRYRLFVVSNRRFLAR